MIGATSDICAEAAIKIARLNAAKLIIGARNIWKAHEVRERIEREANREEVDFCTILELEMTSYSSIENFVNYVQEYREALGIHAVVLNINHYTEDVADDHGQVFRSRHGTELHLQVNVISTAYLAIFLLALLLETSLKEDSPTHLEFVGCERYIVHQHFEYLLNGSEHSILQYLNKDPNQEIQYPATKILQMGIMYVHSIEHSVLVLSKCSTNGGNLTFHL
jgi:NAD(P)-dependent dehydrogenase (short-subunit alcohol dehydrogenase family)